MDIIGNENNTRKKGKNKKKSSPQKYLKKNRLVTRPKAGPNVIFVKKKMSYKVLLQKSCDLLIKENCIILHAMGSAINRCCFLTMDIEKAFPGKCKVETNTGTVDLADNLEPVSDDVDFGAQVRNCFRIHMKITKDTISETSHSLS
ncbi:unnamed protein product [Leptidea sinapis]|uniref:Uncharacterized protein n=1 Tax=Leptidea sinapis TaxID=189913 RepID=A0A5E4QGX2_9NEOP|nr:unnamed protein product [Leptidea sinapis]